MNKHRRWNLVEYLPHADQSKCGSVLLHFGGMIVERSYRSHGAILQFTEDRSALAVIRVWQIFHQYSTTYAYTRKIRKKNLAIVPTHYFSAPKKRRVFIKYQSLAKLLQFTKNPTTVCEIETSDKYHTVIKQQPDRSYIMGRKRKGGYVGYQR